MKVVQINATCDTGSIGKICKAVSEQLSAREIENYILYSQGYSDYPLGIRYSNKIKSKLDAIFSRLSGENGFTANQTNNDLLEELDRIKPDIVHIHNLHSHNCHFKKLFEYLRKNNIKVFYTFHDCWAFTGYCMYFDFVACNKWQTECNNCPQKKKFSLLFDKSTKLYNWKKDALACQDLTIITPSKWLASLVKESFLKDYPIHVINNGIDLEKFKPTKSDFRITYKCEKKFILLGVASGWEKRKGIDTFVRLANDLSDDFLIVLVGTNADIDKNLPNNIISIHRTANQTELAKIYSAADVLVNPTVEENFPTVNIEAIGCGTPVITYNTGGSAEMLDPSSGVLIEKGDYQALLSAIIDTRNNNTFTTDKLLQRASMYSQDDRYLEYINLYLR